MNIMNISSKRCFTVITILAVAVAAALTATPGKPPVEAQKKNSDEIQIVLDFVDAWNRKDVDGIMSYFSDDPIYHNIPVEPTVGREAVRASVAGLIGISETVHWEMINIAQSGNSVLTERVDSMLINGTMVDMPVMGTFDIKDGKITEFRDYFDMGMWNTQTKDLF